jgi:hypothetical protein
MEMPQIGDGCAACVGASDADGAGGPKLFPRFDTRRANPIPSATCQRVFGREEIAAITAAFNPLLLDFKLVDRDDAVVTMLGYA